MTDESAVYDRNSSIPRAGEPTAWSTPASRRFVNALAHVIRRADEREIAGGRREHLAGSASRGSVDRRGLVSGSGGIAVAVGE